MIPEGIIVQKSPFSVKESINRLANFLTGHGVSIYARIDQQAELQKVGQQILPLEFILFGNPKVGGALMIENPITALDLPLKVIAWEDSQKDVYLAFNEQAYIEKRYSLVHKENSPLNLTSVIANALKG